MKKILVALLALAAVAPLSAEKLADFTGGMGRVSIISSKAEVVALPQTEVVDDAGVASGKALKLMLSEPQEGRKFARCDVVVNLDAGQAAKAKKIAFDLQLGSKKAFGWSVVYLFKEKRRGSIAKSLKPKLFTGGEWQHFDVPVSEMENPKGKAITPDEAAMLVISFFYFAPMEIRIANIEFTE